MARRWLLTTLVAFAALGLGGVGPAPLRILDQACGAAASDGEHRAVVIVDTGTQVRRVCVRFTEESITGRDALIRAGVDPVFKDYGSMGSFVCKLLDTGCPASDCPCGSDEYWVYSRARAGSSTFTQSSLGVSSTKVRDGDVEGWKWSTGGSPAYASPDAVCGAKPAAPASPTTAAPPAGGGSAAPGSGSESGSGSGSARGGGGPADAGSVPTAPAAPADGTTTSPTEAEGDGATAGSADHAPAASGTPSADDAAGDGGSPSALAGFVAAAAALAGIWAVARRRRQGGAAGGAAGGEAGP